MKFALVAASILAAAMPALGEAPAKNSLSAKAIHEAESLSLIQDRLMACTVLYRNIKKATPQEARELKEKLSQLSRYFYTDKGLQAYQLGADLFRKSKFQEALEKLQEADDLEKGNVEILHYLALSLLQTGRTSQADAALKRALQVDPIDVELIRDQLAVVVAEEKWPEALKISETLTHEYGDASVQTLHGKAVALSKSEKKSDAKKLLESALQKDPQFPETYLELAREKGSEKRDAETVKLLTKYAELCKNKENMHYEREPKLCGAVAEAERMLK